MGIFLHWCVCLVRSVTSDVPYLLSSHEIGFPFYRRGSERFRVCIENRALIWSQDYLILHSVAFLHGRWWQIEYTLSSQRLWFGVPWSLCFAKMSAECECSSYLLSLSPLQPEKNLKSPFSLLRPSHTILCEMDYRVEKSFTATWSRRIVCLHVCVSRETVS